MTQQQALTSVTVTGVALAKFDTAILNCSIECTGKTGPDAKEKARPVINSLLNCLDELEASGIVIARDELTTELSVNQNYRYDDKKRKNVADGYTASFSLSCKTSSVDRVSEVQDKLTSLEGVDCSSPDFRLKDLTKLQDAALRDARKKLDRRFAAECKALGIDVEEYDIMSYQVRYDESQSAGARPMRAMMASASLESAKSAPPIEVKAGKASITLSLTATYGAASKTVVRIPASESSTGSSKKRSAGNGTTTSA